jgi:hypothetical protein
VGIDLGTTIKYLRRSTSGATSSSLSNTIKYLFGAVVIGLGITIKYLRRTASGAVDVRLGTTIKYLRRTMRPRPGHHDQVPATRNERRREKRPRKHDQVPAAHNERCCGKRLGHHDQVPATNNERRCGQRPGRNDQFLRCTKFDTAGYGLDTKIKYLHGAADIGLSTTIK